MAVLTDAAAYFGACREALLLAREQVHIIGWDIHSRTRFVGPSGRADDGYPEELGAFLQALLAKRPDLRINILVWDFAAIYAGEREWSSAARFTANTSDRLRFCFDSSLPLGSAAHQKIVVIDNSVAFVGGLDLTIRRWDTCEHRVDEPLRRDPDGVPYPPFHDVQCMVDGEAAAALGQLAEQRWLAAGYTLDAPAPAYQNRWPASATVHLEDAVTGIARTEIRTKSRPAVNEVERLYIACIEAATDLIYIENQFTSCTALARALARRMLDVPSLRVLVVTPCRHASWLESQAMQGGRGGFVGEFIEAGVTDRIRFVYPVCSDAGCDAAVMVHSKLMIVDDRVLRIGSANLNNRSMGADTECDLAFEGASDCFQGSVAGLRRQLIGHFCGVEEREVPDDGGELLAFIDEKLAVGGKRSLAPIDFATPGNGIVSLVQPVADPSRPLELERTAARLWRPTTIAAASGIAAALIGLALVWSYSSLSGFADVAFVSSVFSQYSQSVWAPLIAIAAFVAGGLVVFPVLVLIAATAAALGPWTGFFSAIAGVLLSATLLFAIGRVLGRERLQQLLGPRASRVQASIVGKGVLAVAGIRMVPVAPFTIVNIVAGASNLTFRDFLIGTLLGMTPGILVMSALGSQIAELAKDASLTNALLLGFGIAGWIAICLAVQFLMTWLSERRN